jgi:hypothetical protein
MLGVWAVSAELKLGWALLARLAGSLDAGLQPDSNTAAAISAVIDPVVRFILSLTM